MSFPLAALCSNRLRRFISAALAGLLADSPLEEAGFELPVPRRERYFSGSGRARTRALPSCGDRSRTPTARCAREENGSNAVGR